MAYVCWGSDKEDLTESVMAALYANGGGSVILRIEVPRFDRGAQRRTRRIKVTCSQGHENVFTVTESE